MPKISFNPILDSLYTYSIIEATQVVQEVDSQKMMSTDHNTDIRMTMTFQSADQDLFVASVSIDSFKDETILRSSNDTVVDSSSVTWPKALTDARLELQINSFGQISKLNDYESFAEIFDKIDSSPSLGSEISLKKKFSETRFQQILSKLFPGLPRTSDRTDSWKKNELIEVSHPFSIPVLYTTSVTNAQTCAIEGKLGINKVLLSNSNSDEQTNLTGTFQNKMELNPLTAMITKGEKQIAMVGLTISGHKTFTTNYIQNVQVTFCD